MIHFIPFHPDASGLESPVTRVFCAFEKSQASRGKVKASHAWIPRDSPEFNCGEFTPMFQGRIHWVYHI